MTLLQNIRSIWGMLYRLVLVRTIPHTVVSWRFLLPCQSPAVRLHRRVFLHAWPMLNRPFWLLITLYSLALWYGLFSWYYAIRCWRRYHSVEIVNRSPFAQLFDLIRLTLLHGIPPWFYYQYRLYSYPDGQWLDFIFTHELPHWHHLLSLESAALSSHVLADKRAFAQRMETHGLAVVTTQMFLEIGKAVTEPALFSNRSWFIKPNRGSGAIGCMLLHSSGATGSEERGHEYLLTDFLSGKVIARGEQQIRSAIEQQRQHQDLLVQKLLKNHTEIEALSGREKLITIRVITAQLSSVYQTISAVLEIPLLQAESRYLIVPIDCNNGTLIPPDRKTMLNQSHSNEIDELLIRLADTGLPHWPQVSALCQQAHALFPDVLTIGWDAAITSQGIALIEGNVNWAVAPHQIYNGPMLQGKLMQAYQQTGSSDYHNTDTSYE